MTPKLGTVKAALDHLFNELNLFPGAFGVAKVADCRHDGVER